MPSTYNGEPGNISFPSTLAISSSTNASPIVVTTATAHGLTTGDRAVVRQHATNNAANGTWTVTVTGANTIELDGSTGNGVGGATGTVAPLIYGASTTLPSDGDARNAASVNVPIGTTLDRSTAVLAVQPPYFLAGRIIIVPNVSFDNVSTQWATATGTVSSAPGQEAFTFSGMPSLSPMAVKLSDGCLTGVQLSAFPFGVDGFQAGDVARLRFKLNMSNTGAGQGLIVLAFAQQPTGVAGPSFGSMGILPNSASYGPPSGSSFTTFVAAPVSDDVVITQTGTLWICPAVFITTTGPFTINLQNQAVMEFECWRPTGVPR